MYFSQNLDNIWTTSIKILSKRFRKFTDSTFKSKTTYTLYYQYIIQYYYAQQNTLFRRKVRDYAESQPNHEIKIVSL